MLKKTVNEARRSLSF